MQRIAHGFTDRAQRIFVEHVLTSGPAYELFLRWLAGGAGEAEVGQRKRIDVGHSNGIGAVRQIIA